MKKPPQSLTVGVLAGEASGDNLGGPLLKELRAQVPNLNLVGIGGPAMAKQGLRSLVEMETLTVNGLIDPLLRLPRLFKILRQVRDAVLAAKADCFIGIDFNVFNLTLEGMLKRRGIPTLHYVSPSVWAWRPGRVRKIARNVDLMLTLYPFETAIYEQAGVPVRYVGHPLAHAIAPDDGQRGQPAARRELGLPAKGPVVAILPGSRRREAEWTGKDFIATATLLHNEVAAFVIPAASPARQAQLQAMLQAAPQALQAKTTLIAGQVQQAAPQAANAKPQLTASPARLALTACDVAMINSGTATLEAMLLGKPMIMSYRVSPLTHLLVRRFLHTPHFALPNILASKPLVPEFLQNDAQPPAMAKALRTLLNAKTQAPLLSAFAQLHRQLRPGPAPGAQAAQALLTHLESKATPRPRSPKRQYTAPSLKQLPPPRGSAPTQGVGGWGGNRR